MHVQRSNVLTSGIILAGTFPWSNSTFDRLSPRPLVPVAHRPLIAFGLSWLQNAGMRGVTVCGNRNSRALELQLSRYFMRDSDLSYLEDKMPRGAAGCVRDAALASDSQTFVVTDGAAIPNVDIDLLLHTHRTSGAAATVVVYHEPRGSGQAPLQVPAGIYVFDRRILEPIARQGFVDIKEHLIPRMARAGERVATYVASAAVPRVLNAETYLAVNEVATQFASSDRGRPEGYELRGEALIHRDASVGPDVLLTGPVMIGPGATILPKAVIVGPTSIGRDATIGVGALVSRSAVWRRARIFANAVVDCSIVADDGVVERDRQVYRSVVTGAQTRRAVVSATLPNTPSRTPRSAA